MKLEDVLNLGLEFDLGLEDLRIKTIVGIKDDIAEMLNDEEVDRITDLMAEISNIFNTAITRDFARETGVNFSHTERKDITNELKEEKEKLTKEKIELEKRMKEAYDNLSDEYKAKADKIIEDIENLKTPEEKAKRVLEEMIKSIFEI